MNAIMVIHPYMYEGVWVFDDEKVGLVQEPFVSGADGIIDMVVEDIENAQEGFTLLFSVMPFPGYMLELERQREESGGHWYLSKKLNKEGWLCPALFKYFDAAPDILFAQFKSK